MSRTIKKSVQFVCRERLSSGARCRSWCGYFARIVLFDSRPEVIVMVRQLVRMLSGVKNAHMSWNTGDHQAKLKLDVHGKYESTDESVASAQIVSTCMQPGSADPTFYSFRTHKPA